jgi:arginyl-tRNA synthetase
MKDRGKSVSADADTKIAPEVFEDDEARKLVSCLASFPREMESASKDLAPHAITTYAFTLAGCFHSFYNASRILGEAPPVETGRLMLAEAVKIVLERCLGLLGVTTPEKM